MARRRPLLSDEAKMSLARFQGAGYRAQPGDYGGLTSRENGNMVKYSIMLAEQSLGGLNSTVDPTTNLTPQASLQPGAILFPTQRF